jgi:hypothetical protein
VHEPVAAEVVDRAARGGHSDFSPYLYKGTDGLAEVNIELTGSRSQDFRLANEAGGFASKPSEYTWHHHEDVGLMQLVDRTIHKRFTHHGGFGLGPHEWIRKTKRLEIDMKIVRSFVDTRVTDKELSEFEDKRGLTFPEDYRNFLLQTNGGQPEPSTFHFRSEENKEEDSLIDFFFSFAPTRQLYGIEENLEEYEGRIPDGLLPIACDPFDNLVLISFIEGTYGKIYFWDHEKELTHPDRTRLPCLANSFTEFTRKLRYEQD